MTEHARWETMPPTAGQPKLKPVWPYVLALFAINPIIGVLVRIAVVAGIYESNFAMAFAYGLTALELLSMVGAAAGWVVTERTNARLRTTSTTSQAAPAWHGIVVAAVTIPVFFLVYPLVWALLNALTPGMSWSLDFLGFFTARTLDIVIGIVEIAIPIVAGIAVAIIRSAKTQQPQATSAPAGYTTDGHPLYPVVGYTADGQPVTADRVAGGLPSASIGTNTMAIIALITGLTVAPLGVVFGHIALSQIKTSGQDGRGFAIAGLVLGYLGLAWLIFALLFVFVVAGSANY